MVNYPSARKLKWILIWIAFHFLALLFSYMKIPTFNVGKHETESFWPFVKVYSTYEVFVEDPDRATENKKPVEKVTVPDLPKITRKEADSLLKQIDKRRKHKSGIMELSPQEAAALTYYEDESEKRNTGGIDYDFIQEANKGAYKLGYWEKKHKFNGLFFQYDWSEFALYTGSAGFWLLISVISAKRD